MKSMCCATRLRTVLASGYVRRYFKAQLCMSFQFLNQLTDFRATWYKHCALGLTQYRPSQFPVLYWLMQDAVTWE